MKWQSVLAIYFLFWFLSLFLVLPFGVRTSEEMGEKPLPGHADSAPHHFDARKMALRTTIVATILFGLFYLNYLYGWVTIDLFGPMN